jgi:uncharacterized protein (TIGR02266 family)
MPAAASRPDGAERRRAPRIPCEAEIGAHSKSHFLTGRTGDLSVGGMFVATADPLPVGTLVTLGVVLEGGHRAMIEAKVAWVRGPHAGEEGMGVRFSALSDEDAAAIARHLERG